MAIASAATLLTIAGVLTVSAPTASASVYATAMVTTQRMSGPTLNSTQNGWYAKGSQPLLVCYARGESVEGYYSPWIPGGWDNLWYKVSDGYYVADVDINTNSDNPVTPACTSGPTAVQVDTSQWYSITARVSNKNVDVRGGGTANGTALQQYPGNGTSAQKFKFISNGDGTYRIESALTSSEVWDVSGGGTGNGTHVQTWSWANVAQQKWYVYNATVAGYVTLIPSHAQSKCLDVPGGSTASSLHLQIYSCNNTASQQYRLSDLGPVSPLAARVAQFYSTTYGKEWAAPDGTLPGQCVSLVKQFIWQVWSITPGHWGNAIDYRSGGTGGVQLAANGFSWHTGTSGFQNGDILVWGPNAAAGTGSDGHIAIWYNNKIFDQNDNGRLWAGSANFFTGGFLDYWRK
ncbi:MAG TPA: RICIN domain-containing protein [Galbitalea sp.]|jgi:hypothetical protein|nr:RICIN domain-containing protein [Galbitalea sp.]